MDNKNTIIEVVFVIIALIAISLTGISFVGDFSNKQFSSTERYTAGSKAINNLLSMPADKQFTQNDYQNLIQNYPEFPWKKIPDQNFEQLPNERQSEIIKEAMLQSRLEGIESRLIEIEASSVDAYTYLKGMIIWLLSTFFAPVVGDLGKKAFKIKKN